MKFFKLTKIFVEREAELILRFFPELNTDEVYEVLQTEYLTDDDNTFGVVAIKQVSNGAVFHINELNLIKEVVDLDLVPWCFVYSDNADEYEVISDPNKT